jgi:nicotinate phosphoribosyltransferase
MSINPKSKVLVFSNSLNFDLAIDIWKNFHNITNVQFGIGTNLSNDVGFVPLNIVIKMIECNGSPVAKLSDSPGKIMGDSKYIEKLKRVVDYKPIGE